MIPTIRGLDPCIHSMSISYRIKEAEVCKNEKGLQLSVQFVTNIMSISRHFYFSIYFGWGALCCCYIEIWRKWLLFCSWRFQMYFLEWKILCFVSNITEFVLEGLISHRWLRQLVLLRDLVILEPYKRDETEIMMRFWSSSGKARNKIEATDFFFFKTSGVFRECTDSYRLGYIKYEIKCCVWGLFVLSMIGTASDTEWSEWHMPPTQVQVPRGCEHTTWRSASARITAGSAELPAWIETTTNKTKQNKNKQT